MYNNINKKFSSFLLSNLPYLFSVSFSMLVIWGIYHYQFELLRFLHSSTNIINKHKNASEFLLALGIILLVFSVRQIIRLTKSNRLLKTSGLIRTTQNLTLQEIHNLSKELDEGTSSFNYFGITGWETFGARKSLFHLLLKYKEIKVVLLDPLSPLVEIYSRNLNISADTLKNEIISTIQVLTEARNQSHSHVELKFNYSIPPWKLVFFDQYVFSQSYRGNKTHSAPSIGYIIKRVPDEEGNLYEMFYQYFHQQWSSGAYADFDFNSQAIMRKNQRQNK